MTRKHAAILIILHFCLFQSYLFAQETGFPIIRNYSAKEFGASPQVQCILQNKYGLMYFGSSDILEYDGVNWRSISLPNRSNIYDLQADSKGIIYVAAIDEFGYLSTDKKGFTTYQSLKHLLKGNHPNIGTVWYIKITSGFVYFYTYHAIYQYDPAKEKITVFPAGDQGVFWADFVYQDHYYVRLEKKGLMKIEGDQLQPATQSSFFKNKNAFWITLPYNPTTVLIPTLTEGLYLYQPNKDTVPSPFLLSKPQFLRDNSMYSGMKYGDQFVLGSAKAGAILFNKEGTILQEYNHISLLQDNTVYYAKTDNMQNIWLALENGISKTEPGLDLSFWDKRCGLNGTVMNVIRFNNRIYLATTTKIYYLDHENRAREVSDIPAGQNWSLLDWNHGKALIAGTMYGVYEIKGDKAFPLYKGFPAYKVFQSVTNPNRIFSTSYPNFISLRYENGKWISEGTWEGISEDIREIREDVDGTIWIGTRTNGIIRIKPINGTTGLKQTQKDKVYSTRFGLKYTLKHYLIKDSTTSLPLAIYYSRFNNQNVWGTTLGFFIYNPTTDNFELSQALNKKFTWGKLKAYWLQELQNGKIWVILEDDSKTTTGFLTPQKNNCYSLVNAPFQRLPDMKLLNCYIEPSGIVWIYGSEGLFRYDATHDKKNYSQNFHCLVRKVVITGDSVIFGGNMGKNPPETENRKNIQYRSNSINFEFAAPFFDREEQTLYSYQLVGYDTAWSNFSLKTEKEYTNLPENTYTFRVKAKNIYQIESTVGTYTFTILPPWYRTWWAYSFYLVSLAGFIFIIVKLNVRRLVAHKQRLEQVVIERTARIEMQKKEIQVQADELLAANNKLIEMDHFKEGMTGMIVHDLKNPLNTILNFSNIPEIQHAGRQMLNMVLNILDVQKFENSQITIQPIDFSIHTCLSDALQQTSYLYERKSIKINFESPGDYSVNADFDMIQRVLVNILTNAIKYTPNNGTITISITEDTESPKHIKVSIKDTGSGIPPEKIHLIFDKFVQVEAKSSGGVRSTGLGLTFCKMAIEAHGGSIGVESRMEEGSMFWFTLPSVTSVNILPETSNTITSISDDETIILTEKEKQYLLPFTQKLFNFTVYEFSDVTAIIETIDDEKSQNIIVWKKHLIHALKSCNEEKYLNLLTLG